MPLKSLQEKILKKTFKQALALFVSILPLTFTSCIKKAPEAVPQNETVEQTDNPADTIEEQVQPQETLVQAKVLSPKTGLYLSGRDENLHQILSLQYGKNISVVFLDNAPVLLEAENNTYIKTIYDQVEFWIELNSIALQCKNALVLSKTSLYADKEFNLPTDETNSPFRFGDFVFVSTAADDNSDSFDRIYYYDKSSKSVKSAFIKKGLISTRIDDIEVMDCVRQLRKTKRATPINELFRRASKYKPCQKVAAALEAEKTEKIENNYQDVLNALPGAKYKVNVPELLTVDQSKDPFK